MSLHSETCWSKWTRNNRPFPSCCEPHYESEAKFKTFHMKISFVCIWMKTNFHNKNFALSLAFIMRFKATRKWSITCHEQFIISLIFRVFLNEMKIVRSQCWVNHSQVVCFFVSWKKNYANLYKKVTKVIRKFFSDNGFFAKFADNSLHSQLFNHKRFLDLALTITGQTERKKNVPSLLTRQNSFLQFTTIFFKNIVIRF